MTINLSDQASEVGGRNVTTLQMVNAIARRISWRTPHGCGDVYDVAEAHVEGGER